MLRVVFYSSNGVGLGHVMRGVNIAKELRRIVDCEIIFATNTPFEKIFKEEGFHFIRGGANPIDLISDGALPEDYLKKNEDFLLSVIKKLSPHIVVFDSLIMPNVLRYIKERNIFLVYVFREIKDQSYFFRYRDYLKYFDLALLTCINDPSFIRDVRGAGFNKSHFFYLGHIFREPDPVKVKELEHKYKKENDQLLVTITSGGGGFPKGADHFFSSLAAIAGKINSERHKTKKPSKKLRWLFIKGPLFRGRITLPGAIEVYDYESNLPELFSVSDLVISTGGYNSVNEIIAAKTPALVCPLATIRDSQIARASSYLPKGFIKLIDVQNIKESLNLVNKTLRPASLAKMKQAYNGYSHKNGKALAAGLIVKDFFESLKHKAKVGILRVDVDTASEFFIKEEVQNFVSYEAVHLCGQIKQPDESTQNYFCQNYIRTDYKNLHLPIFPKENMQKFYQIVREKNISLLHSQFITDSVSYLPLIKRSLLPVVVNYRGYELSDPRADLFFSKVEQFVSKIVTKSNFQKEELIKKNVSEDKIEVIYGGIDIGKIPFKYRASNPDKLRLLSAGRFVEKKGFDVALKAFKKVLKKYPRAKLTLITDDIPDTKVLVKKSGLTESVEVKNLMPHALFIRELFNHDIFILASKTSSGGDREGIPNVLKEAMASGLPVISTYHSGIPELIADKKTGILVEENDVAGLSKAVEWISQNKESVDKIVLDARFFVEKYFNVKKSAEKLESLYDRLLMPSYVRTIFEVIEGKKPVRFRADLHLVSGCNGKCIMCDNWRNKVTTNLTTAKASKLLDDLRSFGVDQVRFHGQEPTLRKDLFSIMEEAKNKNFRVGLKTNALFFDNDKKIKDLSKCIDDLYLSFDSSIEKIHNFLRNKEESFSKNIKLATEIKKLNPKIKLLLNAVITKHNYKTLPGLLDLATRLPADKVSFVNLSTNNKEDIKQLKLTLEQFKDFYFKIWPKILQKSKSSNIPVGIDPYFYSLVNLPLDLQIKRLKENHQDFEEEISNFYRGLYGRKFYSKNICYGVLDHVTIDWNGDVYPCCAMPRSSSGAIGNITKMTFKQIWDSQKYVQYRQAVLKGGCRFKDECARNFQQTSEINNYLEDDPKQDFRKIIIEKFLDQFSYNTYLSCYRLLMMVYYSLAKSEFYRNKFKNYIIREGNISALPVTTREELKGVFPDKSLVVNYFNEDYGIFRTSSCGANAFSYARALDLIRFPLMAACFLNTGKWRIGDPWLKLTALNCLETAYPLKVKSKIKAVDSSQKKDVVIIPPSENFIKEPASSIKRIYEIIENSKTRLIHANPTYLKLLLYRIKKSGLVLSGDYAVNSTYELLLPSTKRLIEKYLDCQIYDQYGCSEIGPISFRCSCGRNHIFSDSVYVEVIPARDIGRPDLGRVVVTDLENKVMPFIKYFTGDFAYIIKDKNCTCSLTTPLIGNIVGRDDEIVIYKKKAVFPLEIDSLFFDLENMLMYQVIFDDNQFLVKAVAEDKNKRIDSFKIEDRFRKFFNDKTCSVKVEQSECILPSRRGKYRSVVVK